MENLARVKAVWNHEESDYYTFGKEYEGVYYDGSTDHNICYGSECILLDEEDARGFRQPRFAWAFIDIQLIVPPKELIPGEIELEI